MRAAAESRGVWAAAWALLLALVVPFVGKPVHLDDTNFLRLAEGAARDPWRPHDITINWLGETQRALDVLSNPPGIAWWLVPVRNAPEWVLHLWMLPWLVPLLWGARRLGRELAGDGASTALVLASSPIVAVSAQSLTPDLPLIACTVAGLGGFLGARRRAWGFALVAGAASLFRYSGLCLVPLVLVAGAVRGRTRAALAVLVPVLFLVGHDLHAYGKVHLLAMAGFQTQMSSAWLGFRKIVASIAMFGGAGILPVLAWRSWSSWVLALGGGALGTVASLASGHGPGQTVTTVLATAAGGVSFGALRWRSREDRFLALWVLVGLAFLSTLLFAATRYWLPFLPAIALAGVRLRPSTGRLLAAAGLQALVALGISVDDYRMAWEYRAAAREVARLGPGAVSGHWGFQHYLEQAGWVPVERDRPLPTERMAVAWQAWPQPPAVGTCLEVQAEIPLRDTFRGPRVLTADRAANLHSYHIAVAPFGKLYTDSYAPWSFSDEPYDVITVYRKCR